MSRLATELSDSRSSSSKLSGSYLVKFTLSSFSSDKIINKLDRLVLILRRELSGTGWPSSDSIQKIRVDDWSE